MATTSNSGTKIEGLKEEGVSSNGGSFFEGELKQKEKLEFELDKLKNHGIATFNEIVASGNNESGILKLRANDVIDILFKNGYQPANSQTLGNGLSHSEKQA